MTPQQAPALTVVLATWDTFAAIRTTTQHLAAQTVADSIELIICAPVAARVIIEDDVVAPLHSVRVMEAGALHGTGPARAGAIRAATAPIIALAEDHCYPEPGWAEALLRAHEEPHAAVTPAFLNANPGTLTSSAEFYLGYGRWAAPGRRGVIDMLPGHNTSYKRDVLLACGDELERLLESETVLFWDLRRKGYTLLFEPAARVRHTNSARLDVYTATMWHLGRVFGATRAAHWSPLKRVAYALATPAVPLIRLGHTFRAALRNRAPLGPLLTATPHMIAGLAVDFVAQATGALFGAGSSIDMLAAYEFHRDEVNRTGRPPRADDQHVRATATP